MAVQGLTSVSGLLSGIDSDSLIEKMVEIERRPIQVYEARQAQLRTKLAAYQEVNTRLNALEDAAFTLATPSFFSNRLAAISNPNVATATAELGATPGEYTVTVESVARAHQVRTGSYADFTTTTVGTGTLSITSGGKTTTLQVDESNNTLAGLRTAINNLNTNIRASIVQDGDSSYRLLISSKDTGTANALTVDSTLSGGSAPTFSDLQPAADAVVRLGEGANAITVTRSSNSVRDVIPGIALNLLSASPGSPVTVSVTQDTEKIVEAVGKLVEQYNNAVDYINAQFKFDADKNQAGALLGDYTLRNVQSDLSEVFTRAVAGLSNSALADVGITTRGDGRLAFNTQTLRDKLLSDPESVTKIFARTAQTTDARVQFVSAGSETVADGAGYSVQITQAARQARVTAGGTFTAPLAADETLTINGKEVTLTAGMTLEEAVTAINARSRETGVRVSATAADGTGSGSYLTFTSNSYGSAASVSIVSSRSSAGGDASGIGNVAARHDNAAGESGAGTGEAGLDVVGTINGEAATGTGQVLTGNTGNAKTAGLRLRITAATAGSLGTVSVYDGLASAAERTLGRITDVANGPILGEQQSLEDRVDDLAEVIRLREEAITRKEASLRLKFNQLEAALAEFQGQSEYLTSQFASMQKK